MMIVGALAFALLGLAVGSFLNVCISRLPVGQSIVRPRSACVACRVPIRWRDNVPVVSFLLLRGRCRACKERIAWQYPIVEILTSALFAFAYGRFGWTVDLPVALAFLSALVVITAIDLEHLIIPDVITLPGIVAGVLASVSTGRLTWLDSVSGMLVGGGVFFTIIYGTHLLGVLVPSLAYLRGGGMGGGDMKLGAMLGAFLGWKITLLTFLMSILAGGLLAVVLLAASRLGRKDPIPFGPFLALGGGISFFWGERILTWYLDLFMP
jgi:leader peptidase (prepilin peptidase) / N-methyltransferase